jgi:hypothetical protein
MARYVTKIESRLTPDEAFAYLADFSNARFWDPSVSSARAEQDGPTGLGSTYALVSKFAGRDVALKYEIVEYDAPRQVVLQAVQPTFTSRDAITVERSGEGSTVTYDARLVFRGVGRLLDPVMQLVFNRVGRHATQGLRTALNA